MRIPADILGVNLRSPWRWRLRLQTLAVVWGVLVGTTATAAGGAGPATGPATPKPAAPAGAPAAAGSPSATGAPPAEGIAAGPTGADLAPPVDRELALQLARTMRGGEVIWLAAGDDRFFARYAAATRSPLKGAMLIVPDIGSFIGEDGLAGALTESPVTPGWTTLAVQPPRIAASAPSAAHDALVPVAAGRVEAAIKHLKSQDFFNIVIVAQGRGAEAAIRYLTTSGDGDVLAFAGVGPWPGIEAELTLAILDIAGSRDPDARAATERRAARFAADPDRVYESLVIDGAARGFVGYERLVAKSIRGWAERVAPGMEIRKKKQPATNEPAAKDAARPADGAPPATPGP